MKRFFWKLWHQTCRNYKTEQSLTDLIYRCIDLINNCPSCVVKITHYDIIITTNSTKVEFWNANKYYAWLSNGTVNGKQWQNILPSKNAIYDFQKCLKKRGYNIHVPLSPDKITNLETVKC